MKKKKWFERCPECNSGLVTTKTTLDLHGGKVILNDVEVQYCPKCKEELFTPEQMGKVDELSKGVRVSSLSLKRKLSESGRGLVLRIPSDIARAMHLTKNSEVEISIKEPKEMLVEVVE